MVICEASPLVQDHMCNSPWILDVFSSFSFPLLVFEMFLLCSESWSAVHYVAQANLKPYLSKILT